MVDEPEGNPIFPLTQWLLSMIPIARQEDGFALMIPMSNYSHFIGGRRLPIIQGWWKKPSVASTHFISLHWVGRSSSVSLQWLQRLDGTGTPTCPRQMGVHINRPPWDLCHLLSTHYIVFPPSFFVLPLDQFYLESKSVVFGQYKPTC